MIIGIMVVVLGWIVKGRNQKDEYCRSVCDNRDLNGTTGVYLYGNSGTGMDTVVMVMQ